MADEKQRQAVEEIERQLPTDLALLLAALRSEFDAKVASLKAWGVAMCLGGGAIGGFVGELIRPVATKEALGLIPFL